MEAQKTGGVEANGWAYNLNAGKWGQDFNLRAAIAFRSLGQNTPEEAIYMNTRQDGDEQPLSGAKKYTITFKRGELRRSTASGRSRCTMRATSSSRTPSTAPRSATAPRA